MPFKRNIITGRDDDEYLNRKPNIQGDKTEGELIQEEKLKRLIKGLDLETKTNIKNLQQDKNPDFRKVREMPIQKRGGILGLFKKRQYIKTENYTEEIKRELRKEKPDNARIEELAKRIEKNGGKHVKESNFKSPMAELIRANGTIEWYEGVKPGTLKINRSDEKVAYIDLRLDKLLTDTIKNADGTRIQKWVLYENDQNPLPANHYMDSHGYFSNLEEIMMAKKDWKTEQLRAKGDIIWAILIGTGILIAILTIGMQMLTGKTIFDYLQAPAKTPTPTPGTVQIEGLNTEENQLIEQYREQQARMQADLNSAG